MNGPVPLHINSEVVLKLNFFFFFKECISTPDTFGYLSRLYHQGIHLEFGKFFTQKIQGVLELYVPLSVRNR